MDPKLIILINEISIFQSAVLMVLYVDKMLLWHSNHVQVLKIEK